MGVCSSTVLPYDPNIISLSHFEIQRTIGLGGFGQVNAAVKKSPPNNGTWYAIKTIEKRKLIASRDCEKVKKDIFSERNVLSQVRHPFITNIHYAFQDTFYLYLVMDLALGGDLRYHLNKSSTGFTEDQVKFYIAQVVLALELLHSLNIIHRDLKPDNLLLDKNGYIKLSDFGLSRVLVEGKCDDSSGTYPYMAPEIFTSSHIHSMPSDWWSVGIITYEFLFKKRPFTVDDLKNAKFETESQYKYKIDHINDSFFPHNNLISKDCKSFISQLLINNPKYRLNSSNLIINHPWFERFQWSDLFSFELPPPMTPNLSSAHIQESLEAKDYHEVNEKPKQFYLPIPADFFEGYEYNPDAAKVRKKSVFMELVQSVTTRFSSRTS